tara:strand:+ start:114 stop:785 length:672 start_codon:yes stop_codon:yes gene_type:complete
MNIQDIICENVTTDWKPILIKLLQPHKDIINLKLNQEYSTYHENKVFPNKNLIFSSFNYFNIKDFKCLIIGQDCYHTYGVANGLCFSHFPQKNNKLQPSLVNIFKELNRNEEKTRTNPDLSDWAKQGCLLLNMSLTVLQSSPNSHAHIWNDYLHDIVKWIAENCNDICVMLWGNFAQKTEKYFINTKNHILKAGHPSPLNTKHPFVGCNHFEICKSYHNINFV